MPDINTLPVVSTPDGSEVLVGVTAAGEAVRMTPATVQGLAGGVLAAQIAAIDFRLRAVESTFLGSGLPTITTPVLSDTTPNVGDTISITSGGVVSGGTSPYVAAYEWEQLIPGLDALNFFPRETNPTLVITANMVGRQIRVKKWATDAVGRITAPVASAWSTAVGGTASSVVTLSTLPPAQTTSTSASIAWVKTGSGTVFARLDANAPANAGSTPYVLSGLSVGAHRVDFYISANGTGNDFNVAVPAATYSWQVLTGATITLSTLPLSGTSNTGASIGWSLNPSNAGSVFWRIDGGTAVAAASNPIVLTGLAATSHTIEFYNSVNGTGNDITLTAPLATHTWTITGVAANTIGARAVTATPSAQFNKFASPTGSGNGLSYAAPGALATMLSGLTAGDKLALLGGTYTLTSGLVLNKTGTSGSPILIESYPGEQAVITNTTAITILWDVTGSYYRFRRLNFTGNNSQWIYLMRGDHHIIDGCNITGGRGTGITFYSTNGSVARDCVCGDLDSTGTTWEAASGSAWADGFSIGGDPGTPTINSSIDHCTAYHCSDDGFDNWGPSTNFAFTYSLSYNHPIAGGNGVGFKVAGGFPSTGATADHCIAYNCNMGFNPNEGGVGHVTNCTSYNDAFGGFANCDVNQSPSALYSNNIVKAGETGMFLNGFTGYTVTNNSWQRGGTVAFISTTLGNVNFLRPTVGGGFEDIGAYAGI